MKLSDLEKHVGKVVALDLVNGQIITTKIEKIEGGFVSCKKPLLFQMSFNPTNPNDVRVGHIPYGAPLYKTKDVLDIGLDHIIMVFEIQAEMQSAYMAETSGLAVATKPGLIVP